jgi:hypothetical protein
VGFVVGQLLQSRHISLGTFRLAYRSIRHSLLHFSLQPKVSKNLIQFSVFLHSLGSILFRSSKFALTSSYSALRYQLLLYVNWLRNFM